jgi:hypothetical protein
VKKLEALPLVPLFAWLFGLRHFGVWYSGEFSYRRQTEALLHGSLIIDSVPEGMRYDWAWRGGAHQIWGLGMPLLRLPFEVAAKMVGAFGFPDAIVFVILFAAVSLLATHVFRDRKWWERWAIYATLLFCPAFINLCRTRFESYEEAVAGGFLCATVLGLLLVELVERPRAKLYLGLCALGGLSIWIRPTMAFYGAPAAAIALVIGRARRLPKRVLFGGALLFVSGIALQLAINQLRFGAPLEFGHYLNVTYNPTDTFHKVFGNPFSKEPIFSAAKELFGILFLSNRPNGYAFYQPDLVPLQSPTMRFREFYFSTFRLWVLPLVVGGWLLAWRRGGQREKLLALFSAIAFAGQAVVYLRLPFIASRYIVDFAAAFAFAQVALLLSLPRLRPLGALALVASTVIAIATGWFSEIQSKRVLLNVADLQEKMPRPVFVAPPLPKKYSCADARPLADMTLNGFEWDPRSCFVRIETSFFVPNASCVNLRLGPSPWEKQLGDERVRPIRVTMGRSPLTRIRDTAVEDGRLLLYCAPPGRKPDPSGVEVLFVAWTTPDKVPGAPLRLLELSVE